MNAPTLQPIEIAQLHRVHTVPNSHNADSHDHGITLLLRNLPQNPMQLRMTSEGRYSLAVVGVTVMELQI